ncbi:type VI secretion system Vgr family protein [Polyangium sorediatum]|uniref:Type VI secretion system tip protein TssI/VgrG n=1 Tax=Polyangium sorediatum TaxID=889274 RepID=A0ABT6NYJ5_9BACT|nr:type VI secretion system tip protein TssI/VgrG [Polyangium sorediatum]MDI1433420.1 type VI secretion system tip protein TssI/VgrG [Polyangium sorediatum]
MTNVSAALPGDPPLRLVRVAGKERLGEIGSYELDFSGPPSPVVLPSHVLRGPCVLRFETEAGDRRFAGIVTRFVLVATDHGNERIYRATVRPHLALLELRRFPRVIRDRSAPEIIAELARAAGYEQIEVRLAATYPPLDWAIQYDETDATFVRRLCEEHGLFFRFEEKDGAEVLVLADDSTHADDAYSDPIAIVARATASEPRPFVTPVLAARQRRPGKVTLRDYDPERPGVRLEGVAMAGSSFEQRTTIDEAPGGFRSAEAGERASKRRLESLRADASTLTLRTNAIALVPGRAVTFVESDRAFGRARVAGAWFVVATSITWSADEPVLESTVEVIPKDIPFRLPRITPKPRIDGVQSAIVTGAPAEEIDTDALGRVHLAFPWDVRGPKDQRSSVPVRVTQPEAPAGFVLPRVGWEVFVAFEDGDPERPLVLGRSYNGKQLPPLPLPANKTASVLATDSSPGAAARTSIQLDDAAGRQHMLFSAPFGRDDHVYGDSRTETRNNENAEVQGNVTSSIGADETVSVHLGWAASYGSRTVTVGATQKQTAGGSFVTQVQGREAVSVGGLLAEQVGSPVKGAANLLFSTALAGVGARGTAGAIVAAGLGVGRAAVEGFSAGGERGAAAAAGMGLAGMAASMVPGGEAILASVTGSSKPMPWDHGRPPEGEVAAGGGAAGVSGPSGKAGPGPGHRATLVEGPYSEMVGGVYAVMTPGAVSWVTLGPATMLVNGSHTTETTKAGMQVAGAMNESLGSLMITSSKNIARRVKGLVQSDVSGTREASAGGAYRMTAQASLALSVGGDLTLSGGTVTFKCGGAEITASGGGVTIKAPSIRITGPSREAGKLTHK